jgi:serine/threonine protein phosphatase PrpC
MILIYFPENFTINSIKTLNGIEKVDKNKIKELEKVESDHIMGVEERKYEIYKLEIPNDAQVIIFSDGLNDAIYENKKTLAEILEKYLEESKTKLNNTPSLIQYLKETVNSEKTIINDDITFLEV